jgi:hypothetical protein
MQKTKRSIRMPIHAFPVCPTCGSGESLRQVSIDVYCNSCGWDSSSAFVEAGSLDQLLYEFEEKLAKENDERVYRKPDLERLAI